MEERSISSPDPGPVEIIFTAWENNIRSVLEIGTLDRLVSQHQFPFATTTLIINNVENRSEVVRLATAAVERGEIDRYVFADEHDASAARLFGVSRRRLGRFWNWGNAHMVAYVLDPAPGVPRDRWILISDVDCHLIDRFDWITPSLHLLERRPEILMAMPSWGDEGSISDTVHLEADDYDSGFALVPGYCDVHVLTDPRRLLKYESPLRHVHWWSSPISARFESPGFQILGGMLDAFMRMNRLYRAVHLGSRFEQVSTSGGDARYSPQDLVERALAVRRRALIRLCTSREWKSMRLRLDGLASRTASFVDPEGA